MINSQPFLGIVASGLLLYPIKSGDVHPIVQIAICASLTCVGVSLALSSILSGPFWIPFASISLSLTTLIVPSVGAMVGLATAAGLVTQSLISTCGASLSLSPWIVGVASSLGMSALFFSKDLFLYWQLVAPPVVGGYLATLCVETESDVFKQALWLGLALISVALHVRRRRVNSWLERKQDLAVHSKESQIVQLMRSAKPDMPENEFESLKAKLLTAVDGEKDQVDRILFGGGLY